MATAVTANISEDGLTSGIEFSDRYVYSNYFVPLLLTFGDDLTPVVPFYLKEQLLENIRYGGLDKDRLHRILEELDLPELWATNQMDAASAAFDKVAAAAPADGGGPHHVGNAGRAELVARAADDPLTAVADAITGTDTMLVALEDRLDAPGREVLNAASMQLRRSARALIQRGRAGNGNRRQAVAQVARPTVLDDQDVELVAGLLQSTIGYGFLDRTRITPVGFAIGEHVYALGLAPGEKVIIEQRTFTKRQSTFEDQTEQERQLDLELSSTYSTELQEGFDRQRALTDTWGLNISHTGSYASPPSPYGQWNGTHTIAYSKNVTDSSQDARRRSVKDGQTAGSKVAAKYRTQHKTLFRVTTESGFEVSSKRTIHNPNRATPITLHYFKVMQRLRLRQERYSVRLCWAPGVRDPGRRFFESVQIGRQQILDDAAAKIPARPQEPLPASTSGGSTQSERKAFVSELREADNHNFVNGQRSDYDVDVTIDDGWTFDGNVSNVDVDFSSSLRTPGTYSGYRVGIPVFVDGSLRVRVHVDAGDRTGAQPIYFQVKVTCTRDVTVPGNVGQDPIYQAALEDWRTQVADWETAKDAALARASEAADAFEEQARSRLSPVNEIISQIIDQYFRPAVRDEAWEIEYWQRLFDWERASVETYPSWWSDVPARDPLGDPSNFINASWAKLYLPVRVGMETEALRWIHGKKVAARMGAAVEERFKQVVADLRQFRTDVLGTPDEIPALDKPCQQVADTFTCLAEWTELMPTDGTHVEVVQGITSAADTATAAEIATAGRLKDKAVERMTEPATIDVRVGDAWDDEPGQ